MKTFYSHRLRRLAFKLPFSMKSLWLMTDEASGWEVKRPAAFWEENKPRIEP